MRFQKFFFLSLLSVTACLSSCGGGGGGGSDDFIGAAVASIEASPRNIDTGDRMLVTSSVSEVNESGVILKFRYSPGLVYVPSSSSLKTDNESFDVTPTVVGTENNFTYLVYFLPKNRFGKNNQGVIEFLLEGKARVIKGSVEVDPDVDDSEIPNEIEFDLRNPEFGAEDSVEIEVRG